MSRKTLFPLILIPIILTLFSSKKNNHYFILPSGQKIVLKLAITKKQIVKGLSSVKPKDFPKNYGMLFVYKNPGKRVFWMPQTYFNLDIFFLDKNFKVIEIVRNLKANPNKYHTPNNKIDTTDSIFCRHVLEIRSDSPIAKNIKKGDKLIWKSSTSFSEILLKTHPWQ